MSGVPNFLPVRAAPKKLKSCRAEISAIAKSRLQHCSSAEPAQGLGSDDGSQPLPATGSTATPEMQLRTPTAGGISLPDLPLAATAVVPSSPSPRKQAPPKRRRRDQIDKPLRYQDGAE